MGSASEAYGDRLAELRRRMAAVPARGVEPAARAASARPVRRESLPVPSALAGLLPEGGVPRGSVVAYEGAGSLLTGMLAAVTGAGGHAAAVGLPGLGLLAAAEMGAQLGRLAVIPDPGPDPIEIASVLLDGLDLVVLGLGGLAVPAGRCRVLAARARSRGATLVVTGGGWSSPALRIATEIDGYDGIGRGSGRLRTVRLQVCVRGRATPPRTGRLALSPRDGRVEWFVPQADSPLPEAARHAVS